MADLVDRIRQSLPNKCLKKGALKKQNCGVSLVGAPTPSVKIDLDTCDVLVGKSSTKCDYIFVGGHGEVFVVLLELTKQPLDASKAVRQLRAGARIATRIVLDDENVEFRPVVVCKGKIRSDEKHKLSNKANQVSFKGKPVIIKVLRDKDPLIRALQRPMGNIR